MRSKFGLKYESIKSAESVESAESTESVESAKSAESVHPPNSCPHPPNPRFKDNLLKMMKNAFYVTSKALFVLKIFTFLS